MKTGDSDGLLSDWDDLPALPEMDDIAFERLHVSLGPYVRNRLGLWHGNVSLLKDCGTTHADDAYVVILRALTERLQSSQE